MKIVPFDSTKGAKGQIYHQNIKKTLFPKSEKNGAKRLSNIEFGP